MQHYTYAAASSRVLEKRADQSKVVTETFSPVQTRLEGSKRYSAFICDTVVAVLMTQRIQYQSSILNSKYHTNYAEPI